VDANLDKTPGPPPRPRPTPAAPARRRGSVWPVLLLSAGLVAASAAGLIQVLKMLGK
jgi:hypothetical protein